MLGEQIKVAGTSLSRLVGLLGKRGLEPGTGLLIIPSQADTYRSHAVCDRCGFRGPQLARHPFAPAMVPYRMTGIHWKARGVLELPAGVIAQTLTAVGDQLSFTE